MEFPDPLPPLAILQLKVPPGLTMHATSLGASVGGGGGGGGEALAIVMSRSTLAAAKKLALPACEARTVHVPVVRNVSVAPFVPLVVHTVVVWEVNVTGLPDAPPEAVKPIGAVPTLTEDGGLKVMVWLPCPITSVLVTCGAAL